MKLLKSERHAKGELKQSVSDYSEEVRETVQALEELLDSHLTRAEPEKIEELWWRVKTGETNCDDHRRSIEKHTLANWALKPHYDLIYALLEAFDRVPNCIEETANFICLVKPVIPEEYHKELVGIVQHTRKCIEKLIAAADNMFDNCQTAANAARIVEDLESIVDKAEWRIIRRIFNSDLDLSRKLLICEFIKGLCNIADKAEDASDLVVILSMKLLLNEPSPRK